MILFLLAMPWASTMKITGLDPLLSNHLREHDELISLGDDALAPPGTDPLEASYSPWTPWTVKGVHTILVLLVEFPNVKHSVAVTAIEQTLKSMNEYCVKVSYGKISLEWSIADWKTLGRTMKTLPPSSLYRSTYQLGCTQSW